MTKKKLLFSITKKDFRLSWFSGTGAGGQHRNKHKNCCRLKHIETGIMKTGQAERSQKQNLSFAFNSIIKDKEFQKWLRIKTSREHLYENEYEKEINKLVDDAIQEKNLKIEYL